MSDISDWVLEHSGGLIKTKKQADWILFSSLTVIIILSVYFTLFRDSSGTSSPLPYEGPAASPGNPNAGMP